MPNINELHIFLDIDGVLNRKSDWTNKFTFNETCLNNFVKLLTDLKEQYNYLLKIILTSTWRTGYQEGNEKIFKPLTDKLRGINLRINGITPITANKTRQQEINYYISRNNVKHYIILDDDHSLFEDCNDKHLYFVNYCDGLTKKDIDKIKKLFKKI